MLIKTAGGASTSSYYYYYNIIIIIAITIIIVGSSISSGIDAVDDDDEVVGGGASQLLPSLAASGSSNSSVGQQLQDDDDDDDDHILILRQSRVIGSADVVSYDDFPFVASLRYQNSFICGATLISSGRWLLTAAHCFTGFPLDPRLFFVGAGNEKLNKQTAIAAVSDIYIHPAYDVTTYEADIALLKLTRTGKQTLLASAAKPA